jgi:protein-tyrosine phosphatase
MTNLTSADVKARFEDLEWTQRNISREHSESLDRDRPYGDLAVIVAQRNRYMNVEAYAHNRIALKVPPNFCDYINASLIVLDRYMNDEQPSRYIATQVCVVPPCQLFLSQDVILIATTGS